MLFVPGSGPHGPFPCPFSSHGLLHVPHNAPLRCNTRLCHKMASVSRAAPPLLLLFTPSKTQQQQQQQLVMEQNVCLSESQYSVWSFSSVQLMNSISCDGWWDCSWWTVLSKTLYCLPLSIPWRQSISQSLIPLYCTSNFSLLLLLPCPPSPLSLSPQPSPQWSFWMEAENSWEAVSVRALEQECLYMES